MKNIFLFFALFSIISLFSQEGEIVNTGNSGFGSIQISGGAGNGVWIKNSTVANDIDGSYYLFNNWFNNAIIYDLSNKAYNLPNCNFNIESNSVEAQLDDVKDKIYAFNSGDIIKVEFGNRLFVKKNSNKGANQLLEVIHEGEKMSVYKEYESSISKATVNPMTLQKMGKDKVVIKSNYYVEKDGKIEEFKLKKSSLLNLMANKKNEVKSFIKENKLSTSKDEDLAKIFQYFNTL